MGDEIHNTLGRRRCIIPSEKVPPDIWRHPYDSNPSQQAKGDDSLQKSFVQIDPS